MDTLKYRKLVVCELSSDIKKAGKVVETEFRPPAKDEIVIRNHFAGVNATDMNILTGRSIFSTGGVPFDIGLEGMGTIYKLGENVDKEKFSIGTSGLVFANPPMAYAEYLVSCYYFVKQVITFRFLLFKVHQAGTILSCPKVGCTLPGTIQYGSDCNSWSGQVWPNKKR